VSSLPAGRDRGDPGPGLTPASAVPRSVSASAGTLGPTSLVDVRLAFLCAYGGEFIRSPDCPPPTLGGSSTVKRNATLKPT
jgi:hypothetical protein